jgi:hypothetical protein
LKSKNFNLNNFIFSSNKVNGDDHRDGAGSGSTGEFESSFINCIYTNSTSLNNKIGELEAFLSLESFPHLVLIAETWFDESSLPELKNYTLHRRDRGSRGGGVAIYARSDLVSVEVLENSLKNDDVEQIWCGIKVGLERILVGCLYRPPRKE